MEIWCNETRKFKKFTPRIFKTILHLVFSRNTRTNRPIPLIDEPDVSHQRKRSKSSPNRLIHTRHTRPLLAIPRWIGEGRVWKLFAKPSLDPFVDQLRNTKWPAPNISLRLCGKHFRAENRANEISLRRESPLSRDANRWARTTPDEMEFSFSKRLSPLFFLFIFASLSFRTIEHTWLLPNTQLVDSLPSNGLCLSDHRVYSARGTIKRSRTKRCEVEIRRRGNYQAHRCFVFDGTTEFHGGEGDCFH